MTAAGRADSDYAGVSFAPSGDRRFGFAQPNLSAAVPRSLALTDTGVVAITGEIDGSGLNTTNFYTEAWRPQSIGFCFGDGTSGACPCGNASAAGAQAGCSNSIGAAAELGDAGIASIASDSYLLQIQGEPATALSIVLQGVASASSPFGDGLLCAGGNLLRLYVANASGGALSVPTPADPSISARSAALGDPLTAGTVRVYQTYYRDPDVAHCPAPAGATWNATGALRVVWN